MAKSRDFGKKGLKNRDLIIAQAIKYFGKNGYSHSSLRKLAKACKTSAPRLQYYFGTEEEIFAAAIQQMLSAGFLSISKQMEEVGLHSRNFHDPNEKFSRCIQAYLLGMSLWIKTSPAYRRLLLEFYAESRSSKLLRNLNLEIMKNGQERILSFMHLEKRQPTADEIFFSERIHDLITGAFIKALTRDGDVVWEELLDNLQSWIIWSFVQWQREAPTPRSS